MESQPKELESVGSGGAWRPRRPLLVSLCLVGALALGVLAALTPRYETNDDAGMSMIAAGRGYVDRPDEHLLFSNVLVGLGLKALYETAPQVAWYGGFLFLTGCLSLLAICYVCVCRDLSEWRLGLMAVFLWLAGIPALTQLQFTRIAFFAGLAGLLLLAETSRGPGAVRLKWFAIPFLLVAGLIRYDALRLVCVVLLPLIAWVVWQARLEKSARVAIVILAGCVAASVGADHFNKWYYARETAWQNYYPLSAERVEFIDYGHVEYNTETAPAFAAVGWLPVDLAMLRNWAFLDADRYSTRTLHRIVEALPQSSWRPPRPLPQLLARLAVDGELWGLLGCGIACLLILTTERSARSVPAACYAITGLTCVLLYRNLHLPPRVYCSAFAGCAMAAIAFSAGPRTFRNRRAWVETAWGRTLALAVVGALIVWRTGAIGRANANFLSFHKEAVQMVKALKPAPNQLFVVWAGDFPVEYVMLPLARPAVPPDFKILDPNWTLGFTRRRLEEFGLTDWMSVVRRGDGTFLVCQESQTRLLGDYFRLHHGVDLKFHTAFTQHALYDSAVFQVAIPGSSPRSARPAAAKGF